MLYTIHAFRKTWDHISLRLPRPSPQIALPPPKISRQNSPPGKPSSTLPAEASRLNPPPAPPSRWSRWRRPWACCCRSRSTTRCGRTRSGGWTCAAAAPTRATAWRRSPTCSRCSSSWPSPPSPPSRAPRRSTAPSSLPSASTSTSSEYPNRSLSSLALCVCAVPS